MLLLLVYSKSRNVCESILVDLLLWSVTEMLYLVTADRMLNIKDIGITELKYLNVAMVNFPRSEPQRIWISR